MNLHKDKQLFNDLIAITSQFKGLKASDIERDYDIVLTLKRLTQSKFNNQVIFKGGTSLSKCYPGSINRFSEDIDLSLLSPQNTSKKKLESTLKEIETLLIGDLYFEIVPSERSEISKSTYIWRNEFQKRVKLEIGINQIQSDFMLKPFTTYISDYLIQSDNVSLIKQYDLEPISILTMEIQQTFMDKVFAIKRHSLSGNIANKIRHLYDVSRLFDHQEISKFLENKIKFKEIVYRTKINDEMYLLKRKSPMTYNPKEPYDFENWASSLNNSTNEFAYKKMVENLVFGDNKETFIQAISKLGLIVEKLKEINE